MTSTSTQSMPDSPSRRCDVRHEKKTIVSCCGLACLLLAMSASSVRAQDPGFQEGILPMPQNPNWSPQNLPPDFAPNLGGDPNLGGPGFDPSMYPGQELLEDEPLFEPTPVPAWFSLEFWDVSFEAGINGSEGNSKTFNMHTGFDLKREDDLSLDKITLRYNNNYTNSVQTQNNALLKGRHEWLFLDSPWSAFINGDLLYDQFKAFDLRLVTNGGVGYTHIKTEATTFKTRYGAGVSREFGGPDDSWTPEALFGLDYTRQLTQRQKLSATVDYYPEWGSFTDYRLLSDFSWELLIDEEANLSLKLNVVDQYDSTPNGAVANDINYALLLLWKL